MPLLLLSSTGIKGEIPPKGNAAKYFNEPRIKQRVDSLMRLMNLDEKIGQLVLSAAKGNITGPGESKNLDEFIKEGRCGNVFGIKTVEEAIRLQKLAMENTRLGIPLLFGFDVIHGFKTIFPVNLGISSSWDMKAIELCARVSAEEASAVGLNWTFSPMCDVSREPRWGRVSEGSGEDPYLGSQIAVAMVKGYQGDDLSAPNTIMACVKHFAAYGAPQAGRDYNSVDMSERTLRDVYLPSYQAAIDAGAATVMTAFNDYDGVPASASQFLMKDLLRKELKFKGFVVSDFTAINELIPHGVAKDGAHAGELALKAGVNMDMISNLYLFYTKQLIKEKKISIQMIDELCAEVLSMKFRLGLFDNPYAYCTPGRDMQTFYKKEHLEAARSLARSSMVLLQNNKDVLPLSKNKKIALIGPFADAAREMLGSWAMCGEPKRTTTFLQGLQARFGNENVSYSQGCNPNAEIDNGFTEAVQTARQAEIIVLALGLPQTWSGEAASLTSLQLPEVQTRLLNELKKTGKPIVMLLVTARPLDLSQEVKLADAILLTWHPGTQAGEALADVLSGEYNPSGKLTMTFPRNIGQVPIHYDMKSTGRPVGFQSVSNQKYTSKYLFTPNSPLFCFGYGLSYTHFEYTDIQVTNPKAKIGEKVQITVRIKNTGSKAGEEVVQLYIRDLIGSVTRPLKELKGFRKLYLKAGESRQLSFTLTPDELSFCRQDMTIGQESGDYHVWIGGDSDATLQSSFVIQ